MVQKAHLSGLSCEQYAFTVAWKRNRRYLYYFAKIDLPGILKSGTQIETDERSL